MTQVARLGVPRIPHHVAQRGHRRQPVFFSTKIIGCTPVYSRSAAEVHLWRYCLMPNQVHQLVVLRDEASLAKAIGHAHRDYAGFY